MQNSITGEFAGKQISVTLSATNPGSWSVSTSSQDDQSLLVGYDGPVTYNGKELRLEITHSSVKVEVVSENVRGKNTLTVVTPKGAMKTIDILPTMKPSLDFGPVSNILMDDFPFDIDPPVLQPKRLKKAKTNPHPLLPPVATIWVTAKSATAIHELSLERIMNSGYITNDDKAFMNDVYNRGSLFFNVMMSGNGKTQLTTALKSAVEQGCRTVLLLVDEGHIAIGENHQLAQVLREFNDQSDNGGMLTIDGVDVSFKRVVTSATPITKISQIASPSFELMHVLAEPDTEYFGTEKLLASNRLIHIEKDISAKDLAAAITQHPGYKADGVIVLRLPQESKKRKGSKEKFVEDLRNYLGGRHFVKSFDSENKNLREFNRFVSGGREAFGRGAIAVLKDGFSAGFTFDSTERIAAWVDIQFNDFEAQCQSNGRNFGYGKGADAYPILTNREKLEAYATCWSKVRKGALPSTKVGQSSEKRAGSKSRFICDGPAVFKIGTEDDFRADFAKRADVWPVEVVSNNTNSDSINRIYKWTLENISDMLARPTNHLRLRGFDLRISPRDRGEVITKRMCTHWYDIDESAPEGVRPKKNVPKADAYFSSFRKLRKAHKSDMVEGRSIMWMSSENVIISKFEADEEETSKPGPTGAQPGDVKGAKGDKDCLESTFFHTSVDNLPQNWIDFVETVRVDVNRYAEHIAGRESDADKIYTTSVRPAAEVLYAMYALEEPSVVLMAQMQTGKTSIMILLMHCLPRLNEFIQQNC